MKLSELKRIVDSYLSVAQNYSEDPEVRLVIKTSGSVGCIPTVGIKTISQGIDWDAGKFLVYTDEPVMKVNQKTIDDLRNEAKKLGWDMYEVRNLKAEVKKLKAKLNDLQP